MNNLPPRPFPAPLPEEDYNKQSSQYPNPPSYPEYQQAYRDLDRENAANDAAIIILHRNDDHEND